MLGFGLGDTLDADLLRSRVRGLGTLRGVQFGLARPPRLGRFGRRSICRSGAPRVGWSPSAWPTTTSWAAGCGPARWTAALFGLALEGSGGDLPGFASARSCTPGSAGTSRSLASSWTRRSRSGSPPRTSGSSTPTATSWTSWRPRRRSASSGWSGSFPTDGRWRSAYTATPGGSRSRDGLSTLGVAARAIRVSRTRGRVLAPKACGPGYISGPG